MKLTVATVQALEKAEPKQPTMEMELRQVAMESMMMDNLISELDAQASFQLTRLHTRYNLLDAAKAFRNHPEAKGVLLELINEGDVLEKVLQTPDLDVVPPEEIAEKIETLIQNTDEAEQAAEVQITKTESEVAPVVEVPATPPAAEPAVATPPPAAEPGAAPEATPAVPATEDDTGSSAEPTTVPTTVPPSENPEAPASKVTEVPAPVEGDAAAKPSTEDDTGMVDPNAKPEPTPASTEKEQKDPIEQKPEQAPSPAETEPKIETPASIVAEAIEVCITVDDDEIEPDAEIDVVEQAVDEIDKAYDFTTPAETVDGAIAETLIPEIAPVEAPETAPAVTTESFNIPTSFKAVALAIASVVVISFVVIEAWLQSVKHLLSVVRKLHDRLVGMKPDAEGFEVKTVVAYPYGQMLSIVDGLDKIGVILESNISGGFSRVDIQTLIQQFNSVGLVIHADSGKSFVRAGWEPTKSTYGHLGYTPENTAGLYRHIENILVNCIKTLDGLKKAKAAAKIDISIAKSQMQSGGMTTQDFQTQKANIKKQMVLFGMIYRLYVKEAKRAALFYITACKRIPMKAE